MPGSEAYNMASGSPRSAASSSCWVLIALRIPCRRWVGRTAIQLTAAAGSSLPPGIVSSKEKSRPVPTISSPSKAARVRSSSRLVQSSSRREGSIRSPNAMRSVRVNAGSSSRVTGRRKNSDATSLVYLTSLRPGLDFSSALGGLAAVACTTSRATQPRETGADSTPDRLPGPLHATATTCDSFASGAHASDVREPREAEPDSEREQSDTQVLIDGRYRNRDQRTRNPRDLEAGLEPGEAAPSNGVGRVALEEAVEGDASGGGAGGHEQRAERRHRKRGRASREQATHRRKDERAGQNDLLARDLAQLRRDQVAEEPAYTADHEHEAEHPCGLAVVAEAEGEEEREEPDRPPQQTHRAAGEDDARRVELFLLELRVRARLLLFDPGDLPREHRPDRVDERGEDQ